MVMNGCWSPADEGSGHDRWVSENDADKWVLMGHADKCGGMQELKWWPRCTVYIVHFHATHSGQFLLCSHECPCSGDEHPAAVETGVVGDCSSEAIAMGRIGVVLRLFGSKGHMLLCF